MIKKGIVLVFHIFILCAVTAQNLNFKHISTKDGLISDMVHTTIEDSDGFMWFGTEDGLCRYDGYGFLNFFQSTTDTLTLSNNLILSLAEDHNKKLWIGTHKGLNMLDLETYKITRFNNLFKGNLTAVTIETLFVKGDLLWIGTDNSGLFSLDVNTLELLHFKNKNQNTSGLSAPTIHSIIADGTHGLLVATSNGLEQFNTETKTFKTLLVNENVNHLQRDKAGNVLVGLVSTASYYLKLKPDWSFEKINLPISFSDKEVYPFSDSEGNLWVSIRDQGVLYTNRSSKKQSHLLYDKHKITGISSNTITNIYEDSSGNIWISSFDAGLNMLDKNRKAFTWVKDNNRPNGLLNNRVRALYQDSDGDIWVGTKVGGMLNKFNRTAQTFTHYKPDALDDTSLSNDFVFCITEDRPGYLWVGTLNGLNLFNKATGTFKIWKHQEGEPNSLSSNSIYALLKDEDLLYIGNVTTGLDVYNTKTNTFINYKKTGTINQLSDNRIKVIYKDSSDAIWIGTLNGLNKLDKNSKTFTQFLNNPETPNSISENYILSIHEDTHQNLWIGTSLGINVMNRENNSFKAYTTKDGLAGNSVRGILEDAAGNLWLSTNNGLSMFNPITETFKNYNVYDGLQGNEFSKFVSCKTANGDMYFGGNNGFNIFNPEAIVDNTHIPKVLLTDFKLFNQSVPVKAKDSPLQTHISKTEHLVLKHSQSVFSFDFVALNYSATAKNEYAYKMEGFDETWNYVGNKREASYTNLDPGAYVFKVKASNNDGYWNEDGTAIHIEILPPFWKTWWAYGLYALALIGLLLWYRQQVLKRNNFQKQREINALKIKFFANVSHEFRTPLTLILAPLDKLLKANRYPEQEPQLRLMSRHARRLLHLVNQLLDFQKIDSGELKLNTASGDIVQFTKDISELFLAYSNDKHIDFEFQSEIDSCQMVFDHDKMEKIIFNLLSNAFKFTAEGGQIILKISLENTTNQFVLEVKDSGKGIPKHELEAIFKRFHQGEQDQVSTEQGSGIGLALIKEYVDLHKGDISVNSTVGVGSTFKVCIPMLTADDTFKNQFQTSPVNRVDISVKPLRLSADLETKHQSKTPLILIVEDSKDLREFIRLNLEQHYKVIEAADGLEGWEQASTHIPDLIISDVMMPKMDGIAMCSKIKNDQRTSHIPVILLTAQISENQQVSGFQHGADQYVTKPFSFDVLESRVQSLLAQRQKLQSVFSKTLDVNPSEITVTSIDEQLIKKALELVEQNMSNSDYSVDELSKALDISRGHLYRKIVSITGKSPSEFIKSMRLKRAAQLLQSSQLTVSEIAYQVGFTNPKYFSKCFKAEFNTTPSKFVSDAKI